MSQYSLEIVSLHPEFHGKPLKQHQIDGLSTIGVWGNEPFMIRFKNSSWKKVQVVLSLDGTNILSGHPATSQNPNSKDCFVVNPYATLELKAFPETNLGGAAFVFTSADNSVALHTHGDLSSRGIIGAAVFVEGEAPKINLTGFARCCGHYGHCACYHHYGCQCYSCRPHNYTWTGIYDWGSAVYGSGVSFSNPANYTLASNSISLNAGYSGGASSSTFVSSSAATLDCSVQGEMAPQTSLQSLPGIGAGEYVSQTLKEVAGLMKPMLDEVVRVRYLWWDDLKAKLQNQKPEERVGDGFPADQKKMSLGSTPRLNVGGNVSRTSSSSQLSRF